MISEVVDFFKCQSDSLPFKVGGSWLKPPLMGIKIHADGQKCLYTK